MLGQGKEECTDEVIDPAELVAKRLGLLRELVPKAVRVAVLLNPDRVSIKPFDAVQIDNQGEDRFGSNPAVTAPQYWSPVLFNQQTYHLVPNFKI